MVSTANVREDIRNSTFQLGAYAVTSSGAAGTGTATLHRLAGRITTPSLTGAAGSLHTLTLTNSHITASDMVYAVVSYADASTGRPLLRSVTPGAGSVVITLQNVDAAAAFNGPVVIDFWVLKRS